MSLRTIAIPLTQDKVALINEEDLPLVAGRKWRATKSRRTWYAVTWDGRPSPERSHIHMHRLLIDAPPGFQVDHIDGNGLNNTRVNLRLATHSQNMVNAGPRRTSTTGYKGAYWHKAMRRYFAHLRYEGVNYHLGYYDTPEEAAHAYDRKARELHGEFARLNFPDG